MNTQPLSVTDLPYIDPLQPEGWPPIQPSYQFYTSTSFCYPVKVVNNNKIVGIGTAIALDPTGWLGHIIVDKDFRNQGIGTLITSALMDILRQLKIKTMLLIATPLGEPVYKKLGFEKETVYSFVRDGKTIADEEDNVQPLQPNLINDLLKLDQDVSGENRRKLLDPHLSNTHVVVENDTITGFYVPNLGEGLIIATTDTAGKKLLRLKHSEVNSAAIPVDNKDALKFLVANGFVEVRKAIRMWHGEPITWQPEKLYGRIGGNLG